MVTFHVAPVKGTMVRDKSAFHMCCCILSDTSDKFFCECIPMQKFDSSVMFKLQGNRESFFFILN